MQVILQGEEFEGVELRSGARLKYKFNGKYIQYTVRYYEYWFSWAARIEVKYLLVDMKRGRTAFNSAIIALTAALVGTLTQGPDFGLWTFIHENYLQILTANIGIAFFLACFVYVRSFSIRPDRDNAHRELAPGGLTGNLIYDWFMGRELNPRIDLPLFGTIDIKAFCELRPGMLGWLLLDLAFMAHQYKLYGYITDSMLLVTIFQGIYILDALWNEPSILTTMDITTDGFGFMLAFGDLVWLPFIYSLQTRYLSIHPVQLGPLRTLAILSVNLAGYWIFRSANTQKHVFRTHGPDDPRVEHLHSIPTANGSPLLVSGWWGYARHINYLGDWIMSWAWCLPTGVAGYLINKSSEIPDSLEQQQQQGGGGKPFLVQVTQEGGARGWGMLFTYFYLLYFAILLIHRERRDEIKCARKYGDDWEEYKTRVPWRILPGVY